MIFWKGIETTLEELSTPKKKREQIIEKQQKKREFLKPTEGIYLTALHIYFNVSSRIEHILVAIKDYVKEIPYYQDKEKDFFSQEYSQEMLAKAKQELSETSFESFRLSIENMETCYKEFIKASSPPTIEKQQITEEDITIFLAWVITGNPDFEWEEE